MKKSLFSMGMLCIALTLTNCQKEQTETIEPAAEPNFELFAKPADTKTANDGLNTKWAAGDAINIFHAEAGKTSYENDGQFSLKDAESGKFEGTIAGTLTDGTSYDWYAFYPYNKYISTPADRTAGYTTVGGTAQTQTGNDSRAHIAGEACPLYGISKSVAKDEVPSIKMENLASVIKVNVKNNSGEDLTVSSIAFTGTEDIVGTYYINFAASPVTYKSSGDKYVSTTATLSVKNGEAIANGSSAAFYIAVKPFTANAGSTLKLAVNGYEKTITLKSDVTFTAGHIKTLGFDVDKKIPKKVWTIVTDASTLAAGDKIVIASNSKGKVAAGITSGYLKEISAQFSSDLSTIEFMSADASVFTLGGSADSWTLSNSDGALLGATAVKKLAFGEGTTSWKIAIPESNDATIQNGNNFYGRFLYNVKSTRFTTYTSDVSVSMLLPQIYRLESVLPSLAQPTVEAEVQNLNSIFVKWREVDGAADYTVTCGDKTVTTAETEYTFTGLAYSTEYKVSVVANPVDATVSAKSAPGTATVTTGANPSGETTSEYKIDFESDASSYTDWVFSNISSKTNVITAKSGSYCGKTNGTKTASITTVKAIASPKRICFSISKETNNKTASNWLVQVSSDNKTWKTVQTISATDMTKGNWKDYDIDLSSNKDVYVRIYYSGTSAIRNIDEVVFSFMK